MAWLNAGRILRLHQSLRGQPTIYHFVNIDQYLIRLVPWSTSPCTLHHPCQLTRNVAVPPSALDFFRMWSHGCEFANILQHF